MRRPTGNKISDSAVFVALVIVDMPIEHYETRTNVLLPLLKKFPERLLGRACAVATPEDLDRKNSYKGDGERSGKQNRPWKGGVIKLPF